MSSGNAAALRNATYHEVLAVLARLPENERFYLLNRVMVGMNPEAIAVKIDPPPHVDPRVASSPCSPQGPGRPAPLTRKVTLTTSAAAIVPRRTRS